MKKYILALAFSGLFAVASAQTKSFTFVFLNNKPDKEIFSKEKSDSIMSGHMANINRLAKEGKLLAAGPFENGGGIFILNTTSVDEAKEWLSTDPGVKTNRWNLEVLPYTPRVGSACAVGEKFEMTNYAFIRFTEEAGNSKNTKALKEHTAYLKGLSSSGNVITEGVFGKSQGGILVLKPDAEPKTLETDPAVKQGFLKFEMKKLYIAKGSFCEK